MAKSKNMMDFDLQLVAMTDKAVLVSDGLAEAWLPKSQMADKPQKLKSGLVRVSIPEWLARDKGFLV